MQNHWCCVKNTVLLLQASKNQNPVRNTTSITQTKQEIKSLTKQVEIRQMGGGAIEKPSW